jgi:hypothetical protein
MGQRVGDDCGGFMTEMLRSGELRPPEKKHPKREISPADFDVRVFWNSSQAPQWSCTS